MSKLHFVAIVIAAVFVGWVAGLILRPAPPVVTPSLGCDRHYVACAEIRGRG